MFEIYSAVIALLIHYSYWTTALNPRHIAANELFDRWRSKCALQKRGHRYHKIFITNTISEYKKCNMQMSFAFCGLYVRHTTTQEIFIMQMPLFKKILWTRIHPHIGKSSKHKNHIDNHSKIDMIIHILLTFCAWKKKRVNLIYRFSRLPCCHFSVRMHKTVLWHLQMTNALKSEIRVWFFLFITKSAKRIIIITDKTMRPRHNERSCGRRNFRLNSISWKCLYFDWNIIESWPNWLSVSIGLDWFR